ncbi:SH3 domain-containing protein [Lunatibacter salilacus]|uniref:SH3 domain-containing protein n=1 Tax=Lunatibacter salilacus TaxID=2483804 RepID=UPI001F409DA9|nr:SH3 domain-containing protein [Lunatibacter salilacus]
MHFFIAKLILFFLFTYQITDCQANVNDINLADSLFAEKKYQEALLIYEGILDNEAYSPAMLLKMAFIAEGVGDFPKSTLYLSKYYSHNPNPKVIAKIKTLTNQATLVGYNVSDQQKFFKFLIDLNQEITATFALLLLLFLISIFVFPKKRTGFYAPAIVFLVLTFVSNNFLKDKETAIVTGAPSLIMDQPTAAGNLIRKVDAGHRVVIKSSKDIWYEIEWNEKTAYIKKENLSKI